MSQYININISEEVDLNKTSASKECEVWHYWFFKDIGFESEEHVCNGCHHVLTRSYSLENIANLGAKNGYRCILMGISKNEASEKSKIQQQKSKYKKWCNTIKLMFQK